MLAFNITRVNLETKKFKCSLRLDPTNIITLTKHHSNDQTPKLLQVSQSFCVNDAHYRRFTLLDPNAVQVPEP